MKPNHQEFISIRQKKNTSRTENGLMWPLDEKHKKWRGVEETKMRPPFTLTTLPHVLRHFL